MQHCFLAADTIRHAEIDGLRVILDLRAGTYSVLDEVASMLWSVLTGEQDEASTFDLLTQRYTIDHEQLSADFSAFARRCMQDGLLVSASAQRPSKSLPASPCPDRKGKFQSGLLQALLCLFATRRALKREGFPQTYNRYAGFPAGSHGEHRDRVVQAFVRAENFFLTRSAPDDCLLRSLALFRFLRSANVPAEHVIGVRRFPFTAHAWVECDGTPVLESHLGGFTPISRIVNERNHQTMNCE